MHATGMRRGSKAARPCSSNAGRWKGFCHRLQRKKAPFLQHERHLLVATWFTKFRPPSMNYIPRHCAMTWNIIHRWGSKLCKPRVMRILICQPQTRKYDFCSGLHHNAHRVLSRFCPFSDLPKLVFSCNRPRGSYILCAPAATASLVGNLSK